MDLSGTFFYAGLAVFLCVGGILTLALMVGVAWLLSTIIRDVNASPPRPQKELSPQEEEEERSEGEKRKRLETLEQVTPWKKNRLGF